VKAALAIVLALVVMLPAPAHAWGFYAHRKTAAIAEANVSPQVRAKIARLIRSEPALGTPECPLKSLEDAAVWADCIRGEGWRWGYTAAWHYRTAPVCQAFNPRSQLCGRQLRHRASDPRAPDAGR